MYAAAQNMHFCSLFIYSIAVYW